MSDERPILVDSIPRVGGGAGKSAIASQSSSENVSGDNRSGSGGIADRSNSSGREVSRIIVPGGGMGLGGSPLPIQPTVSDYVGKGVEARHVSKDDVLMVRHGAFHPSERGPFAALGAIADTVEYMAAIDDPSLYAKVVDAKDRPGEQLPLILESTNLSLVFMARSYMRGYANVSGAVIGAEGGHSAGLKEVTKSFGSNESEKSKTDRLKSFLHLGGAK